MSIPYTFLLVAFFLLVATALPAARAEEGAEESDALPLRRVTLFTSGVGYFEHRATVDGDREITLTFEAEDINDLLKSMVVQDLGGGSISAVTYGSRDPVSKALQSFAVDLTSNLTLAQLLENLRGERVEVQTLDRNLEGRILSVQTRAVKTDEGVVSTDYLNLMTADGIRSIPSNEVVTLKLLDPRLDQEVQQALATLAMGRDNQKKSVAISFTGEGQRPVRVGYVQETPVWKTSYRMVLDEENGAYLQGWAVVENTTNRDWDDVTLTLVSGAPVSFVMNLYEPLYASRPEIEPELRPGVAPQRYERELMELERQSQGADRKAARRSRSADRGFAAPAAPAESAMDAEGGGFGPGQGVESAARGAEVGELFQYRIDSPVVLARQRSAMIPIVGEDVKAVKLSVFDARVHAKHPLNGVRLTNTTALHLMQGPVTVFDGGTYAGDALLGDLTPGADRLLTYAMDLEVEVKQERKGRPEDLVEVKVVKGILQTSYTQERETRYLIRNDDAKARKVLVTQGIESGWDLLEPGEGVERTRADYRLLVEVPANASRTVALVERRRFGQSVALTNLDERMVAYFLRAPVVSDAVKQAMREVLQRKEAMQEFERRINEAEAELKSIGSEQDRIRKNMETIDRNSELYRRYIEKLGAQEDRVEALRETLRGLGEQYAQSRARLDAYLQDLVLD